MKEVKYLSKIREISAVNTQGLEQSSKVSNLTKYAKLSKHTKENCLKFGVSTFFSLFTYQVEHYQQLGQSLEKIYLVLASNSVNKSCKLSLKFRPKKKMKPSPIS